MTGSMVVEVVHVVGNEEKQRGDERWRWRKA